MNKLIKYIPLLSTPSTNNLQTKLLLLLKLLYRLDLKQRGTMRYFYFKYKSKLKLYTLCEVEYN